ncbi:putative membrane protein [Halorhabdus sp. SVX81]|uniref:DUF7322 domain-containing protein n=1 Tax=Halorhabdus sp. SVX81 TaxID=2978283 RepID=UPI0023DA4237|nr:hypothetical protein [Halorhabdus sp. SVX81]WEL17381.1 putative membrane protein [Halorhabdus sp. SVX81]
MADRDQPAAQIGESDGRAESPAPGVDSSEDVENITEVDPEVRSLFWRLVVVLKVAIPVVSVGILVVTFTDWILIGLVIIAGGCMVGAYGLVRYRRYHRTE